MKATVEVINMAFDVITTSTCPDNVDTPSSCIGAED